MPRIHECESVALISAWIMVTLTATALAAFSAPYTERPGTPLAYGSLANELQSAGDRSCTKNAHDGSCTDDQ